VIAVNALSKAGVRWGLAVVYVAVFLPLLWLIPSWLRPVIGVAYVLYFLWNFFSVETRYGRAIAIRPLSRWEMPNCVEFRSQLSEACRVAGLRREPIWAVMYAEQPNAMAVGGRRGLVIFTTTLLRKFPPEEVLAVAGHELSHLASRDSLPAMLGGSWLSLLGMISALAGQAGQAARRSFAGPVLLLFSVVVDFCTWVLGWVAEAVLAHRSRFQEHQADLAGARLTSAGTMISALQRVEELAGSRTPLTAGRWTPGWIAEKLYASHPPTAQRVAYLQSALERGELRA
jgi:Zn-dependent protease with chaperone function